MDRIMALLNGWLGVHDITQDQLKQLIWAIANDTELEVLFDALVKAEQDWMHGEMKAVNDPLGSSNFEIHNELFQHLFGSD